MRPSNQEIIGLWQQGWTQAEIGGRFGICQQRVSAICGRNAHSGPQVAVGRRRAAATEPIPWQAIKRGYGLSHAEQRAVMRAADCLIAMHEWKRVGGTKPEVPASITDALSRDWVRQVELMGATSRLAHWLLWQAGHDPGAFFNRGIRTGRKAA